MAVQACDRSQGQLLMHEQLWRPELLVCTCVVIGVSHGHPHGTRGLDWHCACTQPQGTGLPTRSGMNRGAQSPGHPGQHWWGGEALARGRGGEELRQLQMHKPLETAEKKSAEGPQWLCWPLVSSVVKVVESSPEQFLGNHDRLLRDEICRGSTGSTRAIEVLSVKSCRGPLQGRPLGTTVTSTLGLILVAPDLPPRSFLSLDVSAMSGSGWAWAETKAGLPCRSQKAGKLGAHCGEAREGREGREDRELLPGTE